MGVKDRQGRVTEIKGGYCMSATYHIILTLLAVSLIQFIGCSDKFINYDRSSVRHYKIVYVAQHADHSDIFIIDGEGDHVLQLTDNGKYNINPSFSRDGENIAYESGDDIYIVDSSGASEMLLVSDAHNPSWAPNGSRLAFSAYRDGQYDIFVIDTDGANMTILTDNINTITCPIWSPDGQIITYLSEHNLYSMRTDGSDRKLLATGVYYYSWSMSGTHIVFSGDNNDQSEIYVIDRDGTNLVQLTDNDYADYNPNVYSFESQIMFISDKDDDAAIWIMDMDGQNARKLAAYATPGLWTPDGWYIIYSSGLDAASEIYRYSIETNRIKRLTDNDYNEYISSVWIKPILI